MRPWCAALLALLAGTTASPASAAEPVELAVLETGTPVAAAADIAAWSRLDANGHFRLMIWRDGRATRARLPPQQRPFDASIDATGRVVYDSVCGSDGCRIRRYAVTSGRSRVLRVRGRLPVPTRRGLAFVRRRGGREAIVVAGRRVARLRAGETVRAMTTFGSRPW